MPPGRRVLVDQAAALERVEQLLGVQSWRSDRRDSWWLMLRAMVHAMDWETGVVTGLTVAEIAAAGERSPRTVSDLIRWAVDAGLLTVVEQGASAAFLGTEHNRTPSYVFLAPLGVADDRQADQPNRLLCDLPQVPGVEEKPLPGGRRLDVPHPVSWPSWRIPETPSQRNLAARLLSRRIGLNGGGGSAWRLRALLERGGWWRDGWCVTGLLYALDHHPDHPDRPRGDALRGATDPIRVLGHRLRPWRGRLAELPTNLHGHRGDYQHRQAQRLARLTDHPPAGETATPATVATAQTRAAMLAELADHLGQQRRRNGHGYGNSDQRIRRHRWLR